MSKEENKKTTNEKPVSLYPLKFPDAVAAILKVKPKPPEKKRQKSPPKKKPK